MAYVSQDRKKALAPKIKAVCKKYGVKATLAVRNHSTLVLNVKSGPIDFIGNMNKVCGSDHYQNARRFRPVTQGYVDVNVYHFRDHFDGNAKAFLTEVYAAMMMGNHDNSDIQTDYFDVGWYVDINIGKWNAPYILEK
jgi:hypothetical protein